MIYASRISRYTVFGTRCCLHVAVSAKARYLDFVVAELIVYQVFCTKYQVLRDLQAILRFLKRMEQQSSR